MPDQINGYVVFFRILLSSLLLFFLTACGESPIGRNQLILLAESKLVAMGAQTFQNLKRNQSIEADPRLNNYVPCVAQAALFLRRLKLQSPWLLL